ncbi:unnamed protein product, partial [Adineta steineri]
PPPTQLIRVLCRHFGEIFHHIYCDTVRIIILFLYDLDSICFIISIEHKLNS